MLVSMSSNDGGKKVIPVTHIMEMLKEVGATLSNGSTSVDWDRRCGHSHGGQLSPYDPPGSSAHWV